MSLPRAALPRTMLSLFAIALLLGLTYCTKKSTAQTSATDMTLNLKTPLRFVVYGDTRFHNPNDTQAANPAVRRALVEAIAGASPDFVCFTGDIVYNGNDVDDWKVWDSETKIWRDKGIPIFPALGNHDLHGKEQVALVNYFTRFPELKGSRYYSMRAANLLLLVLDSSLEEVTGPQGAWLGDKLEHVPSDVDFVLIMDHLLPKQIPPINTRSEADTRLVLPSRRLRKCSKSGRRTPAIGWFSSPGTSITMSATSTGELRIL